MHTPAFNCADQLVGVASLPDANDVRWCSALGTSNPLTAEI
jgi:hypothetical protein